MLATAYEMLKTLEWKLTWELVKSHENIVMNSFQGKILDKTNR